MVSLALKYNHVILIKLEGEVWQICAVNLG